MTNRLPAGEKKVRPWTLAYWVLVTAGSLYVIAVFAPVVGWYLWMMNSFIPLDQVAGFYALVAIGLFETGVPIWLAMNWQRIPPPRRRVAIALWSVLLIAGLINLNRIKGWRDSPLGAGPPSTGTKATGA